MQKIFQLTACLVVMSISSLMGMGQETPQEKDTRIISQLRLVSPQAASEFNKACESNKVGIGQKTALYWPGIRHDLNIMRRKIISDETSLNNAVFGWSMYNTLLFGLFTMIGVMNNNQLSFAQNVAIGVTLLNVINNVANARASRRTFDALQNMQRQNGINDMIIACAQQNPHQKASDLFDIIHSKMRLSYKEHDDLSNIVSESTNKDGSFNTQQYLERSKEKYGKLFSDSGQKKKYEVAILLNNVCAIAIALLFLDKSGMFLAPTITNTLANMPLGSSIFSYYGKDRELKEGLDDIMRVIDTHMIPENQKG